MVAAKGSGRGDRSGGGQKREQRRLGFRGQTRLEAHGGGSGRKAVRNQFRGGLRSGASRRRRRSCPAMAGIVSGDGSIARGKGERGTSVRRGRVRERGVRGWAGLTDPSQLDLVQPSWTKGILVIPQTKFKLKNENSNKYLKIS